jgi:sugar/nucleoside kinase (ribokinase family)
VSAPGDNPVDVVAIGNALIDLLTHADDDFLSTHDMVKGSMALIEEDRARQIYASMGPTVEISGGSAANTASGIASFGGSPAFIGLVRDDQIGELYAHDLRAAGVRFETTPAAAGSPSGRCYIIVTPDGERTMNTYLGIAAAVGPEHVDASLIESAAVTFLEGYLWDSDTAKEAYRLAADIAHRAGKRVALTLSDGFVVDRHRETFLDLIEHGVDVLFANEQEICSLYQVEDFDTALQHVTHHTEIAALTRSAKGSVILRGDEVHVIDAHPVPGGRVVDTTGAGDLYAAGFLYGLTHGHDLGTCGRLAALAASEVISHFGARPETSLADLAAPLLE